MSTLKENITKAIGDDFLFFYQVLIQLYSGSNVIDTDRLIDSYTRTTLASVEGGALQTSDWSVAEGKSISSKDIVTDNNFISNAAFLIDAIKNALPEEAFDEIVGIRTSASKAVFADNDIMASIQESQRQMLSALPSSSALPVEGKVHHHHASDKKDKKKKKKDKKPLLEPEYGGELIDL